jgi:hypothetical protein
MTLTSWTKRHLSEPVTLPVQSDVENQLLRLLHGLSRPVGPREIYDQLAELMGLSSLQRTARYVVSGDIAWLVLVRQARRRLVGQGHMHREPRNQWRLTEAGRELAAFREHTDACGPEALGL